MDIHNTKKTNSNVDDLINQLEEFKDLSYDWDSYNAEKISVDSISTSIQIIKTFGTNNIMFDYAFPMRDGGVQLEKDFENNNIEIEVHPDNQINLLVFDKESNLILEKDYNVFEIDILINTVNDYYGKLHHSGKR